MLRAVPVGQQFKPFLLVLVVNQSGGEITKSDFSPQNEMQIHVITVEMFNSVLTTTDFQTFQQLNNEKIVTVIHCLGKQKKNK